MRVLSAARLDRRDFCSGVPVADTVARRMDYPVNVTNESCLKMYLLSRVMRTVAVLMCSLLFGSGLWAQASLDGYARRYLEQPYVEKVLEVSPERLVIDTARVDCTTLVEYCLARRMSDAGMGDFRDCVGRLRYREYAAGKTLRYADRLHYATEWVAHAEQLGLVEDVSEELGGIRAERKIDFMSNHPGSYPALAQAASDPVAAEDLRIIRDEIEPALSARPFTYIPKNKINAMQHRILPGDIILFTTSVKGLDVSHMAIAYKRADGRMGFIHASSAAGRVIEDARTIADYALSRASITGIKVVRPR